MSIVDLTEDGQKIIFTFRRRGVKIFSSLGGTERRRLCGCVAGVSGATVARSFASRAVARAQYACWEGQKGSMGRPYSARGGGSPAENAGRIILAPRKENETGPLRVTVDKSVFTWYIENKVAPVAHNYDFDEDINAVGFISVRAGLGPDLRRPKALRLPITALHHPITVLAVRTHAPTQVGVTQPPPPRSHRPPKICQNQNVVILISKVISNEFPIKSTKSAGPQTKKKF